MNDQELIRKAIEEAVEEHDLEKFKVLGAALKYGGKGLKALKTGFQRGKNPQSQRAADEAAERSASKIKVTDTRASTKMNQAATPNTTPKSIPYKTGQNVRTGVDKIKTAPSRIKANPVGAAKTTAKATGATAAGAGIVYGAYKGKQALRSNVSSSDGSGGGTGSSGSSGADGNTGPGGANPISRKQASSRFMGRSGKSGHAQQMIQGYKPTGGLMGKSLTMMFKEFVDNGTVPAMAQSMPTTRAEMPMSVLNDSYVELMGSNLPPVKLKVDTQDPDVEKVTEAVMKQDDQWQSAQQIGSQVVDAMMYNPSMIPGMGKVKGAWGKLRGKVSPDAIKDMKFDESGMPLHPKTGEAMDEKQMTQFYGDVMGSKYAGAQGFGQQVGGGDTTPTNPNPSINIPTPKTQPKESNDKPV